jgi:magnesium transporter
MNQAIIDKELTKALLFAINNDNEQRALEILDEYYAEDIAEIFYDIELDEAKYIVRVLDKLKVVNVLRALDEDILSRFFKGYTSKEIASEFIEHMDSDDAVDILNSLSSQQVEEIISFIVDKEFAGNVISLLHYDPNVAGGLMAKELIQVETNWTVNECIEEIRTQAENVERLITVYVVNAENKLEGIVSLKDIILAKEDTKVGSIYSEDFISVNAYSSGEEVAQTMDKYDLIALPVIDSLGRLLGRITIDDVVEFIKEEAEKDYQMASGLSESVESSDKVWVLTRARLPWLLIGLFGGLASSSIISLFEGDITAVPALAFFMPLIAAMGGNAGVQSAAIVVQGLANNTLDTSNLMSKVFKELLVSLLNGLICSAVILLWTYLGGFQGDLSITVAISLIAIIIFASVMGTLTPLILDRFKIDPALATGPFITTLNDVLGLGMYFLIGQMLLSAL